MSAIACNRGGAATPFARALAAWMLAGAVVGCATGNADEGNVQPLDTGHDGVAKDGDASGGDGTPDTSMGPDAATEGGADVVDAAGDVDLDGAPDSSVPDTVVPDTSVPDTSVPDTSVADTTVPDTIVPDTSTADGPPDVTLFPCTIDSDCFSPFNCCVVSSKKCGVKVFGTCVPLV